MTEDIFPYKTVCTVCWKEWEEGKRKRKPRYKRHLFAVKKKGIWRPRCNKHRKD